MNKEPIDPTLSAAAAALGRKGGLRRRTHPDRSALARLGGLARAASLRAARLLTQPSQPLDKSTPVS
jgi:hypothetical protein